MLHFNWTDTNIEGQYVVKYPLDVPQSRSCENFKSYLSTVRILLYFVEIVWVFDWAVAVDSLLHFWKSCHTGRKNLVLYYCQRGTCNTYRKSHDCCQSSLLHPKCLNFSAVLTFLLRSHFQNHFHSNQFHFCTWEIFVWIRFLLDFTIARSYENSMENSKIKRQKIDLPHDPHGEGQFFYGLKSDVKFWVNWCKN